MELRTDAQKNEIVVWPDAGDKSTFVTIRDDAILVNRQGGAAQERILLHEHTQK